MLHVNRPLAYAHSCKAANVGIQCKTIVTIGEYKHNITQDDATRYRVIATDHMAVYILQYTGIQCMYFLLLLVDLHQFVVK